MEKTCCQEATIYNKLHKKPMEMLGPSVLSRKAFCVCELNQFSTLQIFLKIFSYAYPSLFNLYNFLVLALK